jgi:fatty acid synthase
MSAFAQLVNVEGYALLFGGQATPWRATLQELLTPQLRDVLQEIVTQVDKQLEPVANELIVIHPRNVDYFNTSEPQSTSADDADAFVSLTGILLAQFATYTTFKQMFNPQSAPVSVQGHSQGILARELVNASDANVLQAFVVAKLIGAAASRVTLDLGIQANKSATPMLSVKGANQSTVEQVLSSVAKSGALQHPVSIAVKNDVTHFIISGAPQDLQSVEAAFARAMLKSAQLLDKKLTGGTKLEVVTEYLDVTVPFHSQLLSPAVELVSRWATQIGLDQAFATKYASAILVEPVDWVSAVQSALNSGAKLLVDLGPGQVIARMSQNQLQGTATALVNAGTIADLAKLNQPGTELNYSTSWDKFAPELADLPNGQRVVQTAFTKLTGRSPILLAGMTPTTVEPEIVAAATNAGYWVEMAGGGQVTAEVFNKNLSGLQQLLKPGRTVAFNSMFLDRYLWNLQFGGAKIVSRARQSGAPIDGVVITAGIPEFDEAVELIETLNAEGFPFVALKPGTVKQINDVIRIAKASGDFKIIMQVEDGHAGGHHSWENLDDLLLATYAAIREVENVVLVVGGGIGVPERAADYISGQWSQKYGKLPMPVDGVLIGTAAMTVKEAHTTPEVKQVLRDTQGIPIDDQGGWVGSTQSKGGMTSSLSHLRADIYEIDNDSAAAARLILEVNDDSDMLISRRNEIITALNKTAKPYFGDIEDMTYEQVLRRFVQLCFEGVETDEIEESLVDRFFDLLRRAEARNTHLLVGEFPSIFPNIKSVTNFNSAVDELLHHYPKVAVNKVIPIDLAYFIDVCRKHPKPVPFVPVLDNDLFKWWGSDSLWQSHDKRYKASSCRIIPGPVSVAGIDRIDEPVAELLGRFESAVVQRLEQQNGQNNIQPVNTFARIVSSDGPSFIRSIKHISWTGHLIDNPAYFLNDDQYDLVKVSEMSYDLVVKLDTYWDNTQNPTQFHAVRELVIPLDITEDCFTGGTPVVNEQRLPNSMFAMLAATAGVGSKMHSGDLVEGLPQMVTVDENVIGGVHFNHPNFGRAKFSFHAPTSLGHDHAYVTGTALNSGGNSSSSGTNFAISDYVPDALLGTCWPPIYAALGSATITLNGVAGYPVIEGLLNAVHLDHTVDMVTDLSSIVGKKLNAYAWAEDLQESQSGRIVDVRVVVTVDDGSNSPESEPLAIRFRERFAIQGRAYGNEIPANPEEAGGKLEIGEILPTKRRLLRVAKVVAPQDMTAFARVSGDYNPIHTSTNAARVAGLAGPIVHGMWLSAVAQHLVQANYNNELGYKIAGWTVQWYSPTDLNDEVELTLERTGKIRGGGLILEVVAKINGVLTARFTAATLPRPTAYCFPGQGIQQQGMALDEMQASPAAKAVWERADRHTRKVLGFSILTIVRDNPKEIVANGNRYYHPDGLLNLTQFTQVSLAVVGFAQTSRLRESGSAVENGYFAGHSLGEYVALSSYGRAIDLETVIELVFARGSAMHSLVPRDADGRSNYLMGALRPNQFGISDANVKDYVASVAQASGEFLEIVNYNLSGQQYAVAGTIAGLKALQADSSARVKEFGGKGAFMYVPGIDVPFHSSVLRDGVPEFRDKLMKLLPEHIDYTALEQRYIPNLVARPFEFSIEFARAILEVVPSEPIQDVVANWESYIQDRDRLGRILFVELLCWQFASPVRWIETQTLLFNGTRAGGLNVKHFVEIGLKNSPTLANLAAKTLQMPEFANANVLVHNIQRDEGRVYYEDDDPAVILEDDDDVAEVSETVNSTTSETAVPATPSTTSSAPAPVASAPAGSNATTEDLTFNASDAIAVLFAYSNKLLLEQIGANDTAETLTNGVSSRRNQLLMDMSAELGLASIDSAAEAPVSQLYATVDKVAHNYKPFGSVLGDLVRTNIRKLFGSAGSKQAQIASRISSAWGLGEGWINFVTAEILLSTREGASMRGGDLATLAPVAPKSVAEVDALIDAAVQSVAARKGVAVAMQSAGGTAGGAMVDSEALNAFADTITGEKGILATTARQVLGQLGLTEVVEATADETALNNQAVVDAVTAELGQDWFTRVQPAFSEKKVVYLDDRWASAREDLAHLYVNGTFEKAHHKSAAENEFNFFGAGQAVVDQANYWKNRALEHSRTELAQKFEQIAVQAAQSADANNSNTQYINDIAVVTGATPNSIAGAIAAKLLEGSATVVITASNINSARLDYAKDLYRRHATAAAKLYLVPANLTSYRDVDAFIAWLGSEQKETVGGKSKLIKPALEPTLLFPFAAPRVMGSLADAGAEAEMETRLLLWSVERMMAGLSVIGTATNVGRKLHVVLPGSPNRGIFGGDGAYGEVKAAFDAIVKRWQVEKRWAKNVTLAHPLIGWVRGTSLMGGNDPMVAAVESKGIRTYSTPEIADELLALCTPEARAQAVTTPVEADLTGGLGNTALDLAALKAEVKASMMPATSEVANSTPDKNLDKNSEAYNTALPSHTDVTLPTYDASQWTNVDMDLKDMRVIVGIGEVGPWGSGRTRFDAEGSIQTDGSVNLSPVAVIELAWMMGLLHWSDTPTAGWYDADGTLVPEGEIVAKYRDEVVARCGVREYVDDDLAWIQDLATEQDVAIFLDRDITFTVPNQEAAVAFKNIDPDKTLIYEDEDGGDWVVTKLKGAKARVPRKATMTRRVGGQLPTDFDPAKWGIPASMIESVDRLAIWNLVATVDAFLSGGFTPAELLKHVHPSDVGSTQGTGIGGTDSMRKLFVDGFLGEDRPTDILQEALPNVIAAHVMQSYVGGYGVMVHPVGACATAAVSIEDAVDKIDCGKADFVVAGAIDDISIESITGFGDMNATAKTQDLLDKGINKRFVSRANDRRRGGFVESEGGGTVLVTRGDIALKMGLPVFGVIGYARSFADGAHTSIPAPGLGALGAARGGRNSKLVQQLAKLSVTPDDVAVISKHDTSTNANDPNESELYTRLFAAIGRTQGNPAFVISQKTVTGHAKGGAAVFQVNGLTQLFKSGRIPANRALDCVGDEFKGHDPIVWLREPLDLGAVQTIKAGMVTSLGFGHVAGLIAVVNPGAFFSAVAKVGGADELDRYLKRANERRQLGNSQFTRCLMGKKSLFEPVSNRRFSDQSTSYDPHEVEANLLLNPDGKLGEGDMY